jgi:hypothetical protein
LGFLTCPITLAFLFPPMGLLIFTPPEKVRK